MTNYYEHWSFRRRRQQGLTIVEVAVVLAIAAVISAGVSRQLAENAESVKVRNAATQMDQVVEAAQAYMSARQADLVAATAGGPVTVPITGGTCTGATPSLQACGYLPSSFVNTNPFAQTHSFRVRQPAADVLEGFVATSGGASLPSAKVPRAASLVGPEGGFVGEADVPGCPVGAACGSYGGWQIDAATLASIFGAAPASGHLVAAMAFANGAIVPDYLYRVSVPGHPEANQMFTDLHMDGGGTKHDVDGVATLTADDGIFGNDVAVGRDLAVGRDVAVVGNVAVTGNTDSSEFRVTSMGNQPVSEAVYDVGVYAPESLFAKPTCPSGKTQEIFVAPAAFSDNGVGNPISTVRAWAEDAGGSWRLKLYVWTSAGAVQVNSSYGRITAFAKCS